MSQHVKRKGNWIPMRKGAAPIRNRMSEMNKGGAVYESHTNQTVGIVRSTPVTTLPKYREDDKYLPAVHPTVMEGSLLKKHIAAISFARNSDKNHRNNIKFVV